jgi:predicted nucleotidyltransferase
MQEASRIPRQLTKKVLSVLKRYGVEHVAVVGSFARQEARQDSDLDLIVRFAEPRSLLELARIRRELSESIGRDVHLLTEQSISPYLIDSFREDAVVILG